MKLARFPCALWIFRDAAVLPGTAWLPGQLAQKCGPIAATTLRKTGSVGTRSQLLFEDFCDPESVARKQPCFRARNSASFWGPENGLVFRTEQRPPILRCVDWGRFSASKTRPFSGFGIGPFFGLGNMAAFSAHRAAWNGFGLRVVPFCCRRWRPFAARAVGRAELLRWGLRGDSAAPRRAANCA